jgi:GTP cyclohydrolase IA
LHQTTGDSKNLRRVLRGAITSPIKPYKLAYSKKEIYSDDTTGELKNSYKDILSAIGEDPDREGLLKTPERAAKAMQFFTQGYDMDAQKILRAAIFHESYSEMVLVKNIELYSLCEHHLLPFFGKAHIAYIPDGKIVGLSKMAHVVECFARRLQVQERMTHQILDVIQETLQPIGVGVVIEAQHLCMMMRGVQKQNSSTTTSAFSGQFMKNETRAEFLRLISSNLL